MHLQKKAINSDCPSNSHFHSNLATHGWEQNVFCFRLTAYKIQRPKHKRSIYFRVFILSRSFHLDFTAGIRLSLFLMRLHWKQSATSFNLPYFIRRKNETRFKWSTWPISLNWCSANCHRQTNSMLSHNEQKREQLYQQTDSNGAEKNEFRWKMFHFKMHTQSNHQFGLSMLCIFYRLEHSSFRRAI